MKVDPLMSDAPAGTYFQPTLTLTTFPSSSSRSSGVLRRPRGHSARSACTVWAQRAHYRGKLGIFATIGNILASVDHTAPHNIAQPDVSPPPPAPCHPQPQIAT